MKDRTRTRIAIAFCCAATLPLLAADGAGRLSLQRAVDEAAARGGGRVVVPAGEWITGSIELKSGVELHLEKGAVLKGSADPADYNANDAFPENRWSDGEEWSGGHLVWGRCVTNVAITGEGTIDGNGPAFFGDCEEVARWPYYKYGLKLHPIDRTWFRPGMMVAFFRSQGIRLEGVTLANTPAWTCHFRCCDGVDIRNVTIDADRTIANSDGFSIDCTRNVRVEGCTVRTGDDGFAIRASCPLHAADNPCENIVITNCDVSSCCYGIRFGVGTGTIRHVRVEDTRILEAAGAGVGFTPAWVDAKRNCHIEDILLRGCTVSECVRPVEVVPAAGDSRVTGVRFERCVFNTLLPPRVEGGPDVSMAFADCTRNTIERFKVRHQLGWSEREIRIVHCGDPQLGFGPGGEAAAEAKYAEDLARFERVIAAVNELKPDLCFIAGDMAHVGERLERDWPRLAKAFKVPFVVAPGNHDLGDRVTKESVERFERVFGYSYKSLKVGDWRFICGNSQYWRPTDETERKAKYEAWVADELAKAKAAGEKLILGSHIPPFTMRSDEPDSWENCPMAVRRERVKAYLDAGARFYLAGHTHTMLARAFHGMTILNAETTCWNFDGLPFGFRVLTIRADGSYDWDFRKVE